MRVALVHDHLGQDGGAERVVRIWQKMFPEAPLYTLVYHPNHAHPEFRGTKIHTSFLQRLPAGSTRYQWYLPLMPTAVERYDLSEYDVVLSSAASFAKGVLTKPNTLHLSYIHSPTRYLWSDSQRYVDELPYSRLLRSIAPIFLTRIRMWDYLAAQRPDVLLANSKVVQGRIRKYYKRSSDILYPPVDVSRFHLGTGKGQYYLAGGRLVTYKRFDIVIKAFNQLGLPLKIYGSGPAQAELRSMAHSNIEFLGRVDDKDLPGLYADAIAFLNPQEEDFGITVVEAMAAGRPVIAYAAGGALETIKSGVSGVFFEDQDWEALANTIIRFKTEEFQPKAIRAVAEAFSTEKYMTTFRDTITEAYQHHQQTYA